MHVSDFVKLSGGKVLTGEYEDREIVCGYTCDLLSHVMGKGQADMAWITVQAHMNVIAVAALLDFACVIIPENLPVDETIVNFGNFELEKTTKEVLACARYSDFWVVVVVVNISNNGSDSFAFAKEIARD